MIKMFCLRCKHEWDYKGIKEKPSKYPQYISCPKCRTSVKIKIVEKKENGS